MDNEKITYEQAILKAKIQRWVERLFWFIILGFLILIFYLWWL